MLNKDAFVKVHPNFQERGLNTRDTIAIEISKTLSGFAIRADDMSHTPEEITASRNLFALEAYRWADALIAASSLKTLLLYLMWCVIRLSERI